VLLTRLHAGPDRGPRGAHPPARPNHCLASRSAPAGPRRHSCRLVLPSIPLYYIYATEFPCIYVHNCANAPPVSNLRQVDAYYPARTCRATRTACDTRGQTVRRLGATLLLKTLCQPGSAASIDATDGLFVTLGGPKKYCPKLTQPRTSVHCLRAAPLPSSPRQTHSTNTVADKRGVLRSPVGRVWRGLLHVRPQGPLLRD
jgi:hypothetical protein